MHKPKQQAAEATAAQATDSSNSISDSNSTSSSSVRLVNNVVSFSTAQSLQGTAVVPAAAFITQQQAAGAMHVSGAGYVATVDR